MIPASTLKIVTTAAALRQLGNNYKFKTRIAYTGKLNKESGVLDGDVLIIGGGDPTLQSEQFNSSSKLITDQWAQIIKDAGIKDIKGKIIGDASVWDHKVPGNWIWGDIGNYFGAVPCGLSFIDNQFKLVFTTKAEGSNASISEIQPEFLKEKLKIENTVKAKGTSDEAYVFGDPLGYNKHVSGFLPPNKSGFEVKASLPDPAYVCAEYLFRSLKQIGVNCNSKQVVSNYVKQDSLVQLTTIHTHYSPSLEKIVQVTNNTSNNLFAETLIMALGNGNIYAGFESVKKYLSTQKLDTGEINLTDGSGLSRANLISTGLQAELLDENLGGCFYQNCFLQFFTHSRQTRQYDQYRQRKTH
jgi:serine-type D-Ala-D-Ala carboxypeptidase/endopeptidase (penicillin-binding protein 4)